MSDDTFYGPDFELLSKQDPDIAAVVLSELKRQQQSLQLIASETSPRVQSLQPLAQHFQINMPKVIQVSVTTAVAKKLIRPKLLQLIAPRNFSGLTTQMCNHIQGQVQTLRSIKHLLNLATPCLLCHCHMAVT